MAKDFGETTKVKFIPKNDNGDFIRVSRIIPDRGLEAIDIRAFYTSDRDGEKYPTAKGVRIHSEMLVETVVAVLNTLSFSELCEVMEEIGVEVKGSTPNEEEEDE